MSTLARSLSIRKKLRAIALITSILHNMYFIISCLYFILKHEYEEFGSYTENKSCILFNQHFWKVPLALAAFIFIPALYVMFYLKILNLLSVHTMQRL